MNRLSWWQRWIQWWHGETVFPVPRDPILLRETVAWFRGYTHTPGVLSEEKRKECEQAATVLFERMTPTGLRLLRRHVKQIEFHESLENLTVAVAGDSPEVRALIALGIYAGGAYNRLTGHLDLDGRDEDNQHDTV